jgi:hypothetical protein
MMTLQPDQIELEKLPGMYQTYDYITKFRGLVGLNLSVSESIYRHNQFERITLQCERHV